MPAISMSVQQWGMQSVYMTHAGRPAAWRWPEVECLSHRSAALHSDGALM